MPTELDLVIGDVHMKATTKGCSSPQGQMCQALPSGASTAELYLGDMLISSKMLTIDPTKQYLFGLAPAVGMEPDITITALPAGASCASTGSSGASGGGTPPPPPSQTTGVKFCNRLGASAGVAELKVGANITLQANPGACAPMPGAACASAASGPTMVTLTLGGQEQGGGSITLPAGQDVVIMVLADAAGDPTLDAMGIPSGMSCSMYEPK